MSAPCWLGYACATTETVVELDLVSADLMSVQPSDGYTVTTYLNGVPDPIRAQVGVLTGLVDAEAPNGALQWQPTSVSVEEYEDEIALWQEQGRTAIESIALDRHGHWSPVALHEEYPDLVPVWHAFRDARARCRAVQWLLGEALVSNDSAGHFLSDHPDPDLPWLPRARQWAGSSGAVFAVALLGRRAVSTNDVLRDREVATSACAEQERARGFAGAEDRLRPRCQPGRRRHSPAENWKAP